MTTKFCFHFLFLYTTFKTQVMPMLKPLALHIVEPTNLYGLMVIDIEMASFVVKK
jgi:hypothetical protein